MHAPTRREFVYGLGASLGSVALTSLLASESQGPLAPKAQQVPAKAKRCIYLHLVGSPPQMETFVATVDRTDGFPRLSLKPKK